MRREAEAEGPTIRLCETLPYSPGRFWCRLALAAAGLFAVAVTGGRGGERGGGVSRRLKGRRPPQSWSKQTQGRATQKASKSLRRWNETFDAPFDAAAAFDAKALARVRAGATSCSLQRIPKGAVINLAVARTGSEWLSLALRNASQPNHHNHDCTLFDIVRAQGTRVLATTRSPLARIVSGWQRRMDAGNSMIRAKPANKAFVEAFGNGNVNDYMDALRNVSHPKHVVPRPRPAGWQGTKSRPLYAKDDASRCA
ncbi:hypothetical protein M885DRAFT_523846 [Pelagophyceae sp. CCMP2097]|nr:hypothetical protein M885DRAFT_523846 [Pelagophyceae sp. CCMP2097]